MSKITDMTSTHNWSGQKLVSTDHLLFEAPREKHFITGAQAMAEARQAPNRPQGPDQVRRRQAGRTRP